MDKAVKEGRGMKRLICWKIGHKLQTDYGELGVMLILAEGEKTIKIMFSCEECGEVLPIASCSLSKGSDLRMLCHICRALSELDATE